MKKFLIFLIATIFFNSVPIYAQPPDEGDCDPDAEINEPGYCMPIPVDESVLVLVIVGIGFGIWKLKEKDHSRLRSLSTH